MIPMRIIWPQTSTAKSASSAAAAPAITTAKKTSLKAHKTHHRAVMTASAPYTSPTTNIPCSLGRNILPFACHMGRVDVVSSSESLCGIVD